MLGWVGRVSGDVVVVVVVPCVLLVEVVFGKLGFFDGSFSCLVGFFFLRCVMVLVGGFLGVFRFWSDVFGFCWIHRTIRWSSCMRHGVTLEWNPLQWGTLNKT